jgi:hypothetical protein
MDKEVLEKVLELQQKVDFYERVYIDMLFLLVFEDKVNIPKTTDALVNECFNKITSLKAQNLEYKKNEIVLEQSKNEITRLKDIVQLLKEVILSNRLVITRLRMRIAVFRLVLKFRYL